ncbi:hypothetical protein BHE74_00007603 [Ensete ventricosum]|uniref:Uncharacterized protein n=1 Tax=Ensete ventricosum TaxID=4639 RepID=A0A426ZN86_ENSVE|nr:hypothetical protein B296_00022782 [Ensete ventricosum]RWW28339.1 hypothetical protein GW17_00007177 [Ensete ventricosum]RWW83872.1 hypothetical protein BHE74_00007603 [Ensete ventricosum]
MPSREKGDRYTREATTSSLGLCVRLDLDWATEEDAYIFPRQRGLKLVGVDSKVAQKKALLSRRDEHREGETQIEALSVGSSARDRGEGDLHHAPRRGSGRGVHVEEEKGRLREENKIERRNKQLTSAGGGFPGEVVEAWIALLLMVRRRGGNGLPSRENSDVQLLEVSRPARKLSHMINTWFGVANLDGGSKCFSNGHLKDALDAQESLKLRSRKTIPHKGESMEGARIGHELENPRRYAVNSYSSRLQEEKLCSSLSWRSCGEEMKKVIRESLHGQNLLQISSDDEKTSSSRSLGVYVRSALGSSYHETEGGRKNFTAASEQPTKMKAPSLIARLMGLEEVPAEAAETIRKEGIRENLNAPRSMFRVGMPEAGGRLLLPKHSPKPERVTLQSIIEREKIERLAERGQEIGCRNQSDTSADERYSKGFHMDEEDSSTIKAMQLPERGEQHELLASRPPSSQESTIQATKVEHDEVIANRRRELAHESVRKEAVSLKKSKVESSKKSKMPASVCHGQQQKEAKLHKRSDQGQKSLSDRTTPQNRKGLRAAAAPLSQAKKATTASTEPNKRAASTKSIAVKAGATQQKSMMKPQREMVSGNSTNAAAEKRTAAAKPARKMMKLKVFPFMPFKSFPDHELVSHEEITTQ